MPPPEREAAGVCVRVGRWIGRVGVGRCGCRELIHAR